MDKLTLGAVTMCASKATAAAGTTTTFNTTGATLYSIGGKAYSTAAAANAATPTTDGNTGAAFVPVGKSKGSVFVLAYDGQAAAANAIKVYQGSVEALTSDASGADAKFIGPGPTFPSIPSNVCAFAYLITKVGASGTPWTFGASNLAGPPSNVLHTFTDVFSLPDRPQV